MVLSSEKDDPHLLHVTAPADDFGVRRLPVAMPWRVVMAGLLDDIVNSNLLENLNPPCKVEDASFIKPSMVAWTFPPWWSTAGRMALSV